MNRLFIGLGLLSFIGPALIMEISSYDQKKSLKMAVKLILIISFSLSIIYFIGTYNTINYTQSEQKTTSSIQGIMNSLTYVSDTIDSVIDHFRKTINTTLLNFIFNTLFGLLGTSTYLIFIKLFIKKQN